MNICWLNARLAHYQKLMLDGIIIVSLSPSVWAIYFQSFGWPQMTQSFPLYNGRYPSWSQGNSGDNLWIEYVLPTLKMNYLWPHSVSKSREWNYPCMYEKWIHWYTCKIKMYLQMMIHLKIFKNVLGMCLLLFNQHTSPYQILYRSSGSCKRHPWWCNNTGWWWVIVLFSFWWW